MRAFLTIALGLCPLSTALLGKDLKAKLRASNKPSKDGQLPPVFATDYLPDNFEEGQNATAVELPGWPGPLQHSGFFRFNAERGDSSPVANTFFWYLPSLDGNPDAPLLLWLQGGPGGSSLYGMFTEIGPFTVDADGNVVARDPDTNWNQKFGLLFLDNPCGVGFSFSDDVDCYVTNEKEVGSDVYAALQQFFQLFPDQRANDFYITGESYAGKYIPASAYTIFVRNQQLASSATPTADASEVINLRGISIGDGAMDPPAQFKNYGELLWYLGMVSADARQGFKAYEASIQAALLVNDTVAAFQVFDEMLNGDFQEYPTYYNNVTGLTNYFNFEQGDCGACAPDYSSAWLDSNRDLIHAGGLPYDSFNDTVEEYLVGDWMVGVVDMLVPLLEAPEVKVLIYSGQNDVILGPPLTEQFLNELNWAGKGEFASAPTVVWSLPSVALNPVAGYVKQTANFGGLTYAVVRGAGHMVPGDQPERAYDLITRFVEGVSFARAD